MSIVCTIYRFQFICLNVRTMCVSHNHYASAHTHTQILQKTIWHFYIQLHATINCACSAVCVCAVAVQRSVNENEQTNTHTIAKCSHSNTMNLANHQVTRFYLAHTIYTYIVFLIVTHFNKIIIIVSTMQVVIT